MKKLLEIQLQSSIIYMISYLIKSFIMWELNNPFQWIIDMPSYTPNQRINLILCIGIYYFINAMIYWNRKRKP